MSTYDEGWLAFYQGVTAYDNPYSPEHFQFNADPEEDDNNREPIAIIGNPMQSQYEIQLENFGHKHNEWARGHKDAADRNFGYDRNTTPPKQKVING